MAPREVPRQRDEDVVRDEVLEVERSGTPSPPWRDNEILLEESPWKGSSVVMAAAAAASASCWYLPPPAPPMRPRDDDRFFGGRN